MLTQKGIFNNHINIAFVICVLWCVVPLPVNAKLTMPAIFGNHMVLLRNQKLHLYGQASPGSRIIAVLNNVKGVSGADEQGKWQIELPPMKAGGPYTLEIRSGKDKLTFSDVMIGEVWLVSGQSNMALPLFTKGNPLNSIANGEELADAADNNSLRLCREPYGLAPFGPQVRRGLRWCRCCPDKAARFSGIGYLFGNSLQKKLNVPVGIIQAAFPNTRIQTWLPESAIRKSNLVREIASLDERDRNLKETKEQYHKARRGFFAYVKWKKQGKKGPPPQYDTEIVKHFGKNYPSTMFNSMIYSWMKYSIRGILWYQGESNTNEPDVYRRLFPLLIKTYQQNWIAPKPAFLFVQLSAWQAHRPRKRLPDDFWKSLPPQDSNWAELREAQEHTLDVSDYTGMAVSLDHGDHSYIHPAEKGPVAERLLNEALRLCYGYKLQTQSPRFDKAVRERDALRLFFKNTAGGLEPQNKPIGNFAIAGKDRRFVRAEARVDGENIIVRSPLIKRPVYVRYAWANFPGGTYFYNRAGLPCGSFRNDGFDHIEPGRKTAVK